ncbi:MAG: calcium/sodium antiporter [Bacteroidetes bacterium]|jgi:cation:H+ antiporter|nr:calcium/sodium antiporter [Bacteroidota bacterium]
MALDVVFVAAGILLLFAGGELLVRGALAVAERMGVSPLVSGLVIVGFGTSAPELVVSVDAALNARPDIALGNVVGSNISNLLLILGVCALITPVAVRPMALRRDTVAMVGATALFVALAATGTLGLLAGAVLLAALLGYGVWAYGTERSLPQETVAVYEATAEVLAARPQRFWLRVGALPVGLGLLVGGSRVLLGGAVGIAEAAGLSEAVIGLTLVAVGTSLPELAVGVVAAFRQQADVAVGNVLGSNIFNVLGILGVAALLQPLPVPARIVAVDQWMMLGTALLVWGALYTGRQLSRWEGALLLGSYSVYLGLGLTVWGA